MIREKESSRRVALILCGLTTLALTATWGARDRASLAAPGLMIAAHDPEAPRASIPITLDRIRRTSDGLVADLGEGARAELTLDPRLQRLADRVLAAHHAPYAAAVMLSVDDGRVLALAGRSEAEPQKTAAELCLTAWAPAASVFKVVTAAALVDGGVRPGARVCYHGGVHSLEASNLSAHPRLDRECNTLAYGIARSQNAIIARLAHDHLEPAKLERVAHALGFGETLPFDAPVAPSTVDLPQGGLAFARVAAGFWQTSLSPLHGAWIAATIGRGGVTPPMRIVERVVRGRDVVIPEAPVARRVLDEKTARAVGAMMVGTTQYGTARLGFHNSAGRTYLPGVAVAGKTGSLNRKEGPFLAYSWFIGFAPAERPEVAVAVLLGNGSGREARAHKVARELLEGYFHGAPKMVVALR
ncbi:MAG: penicillin-binding protein [Myxococcales bacterium]|nr:penicillin-binding protein [Myxococcales bacterium]